MGLDQNDRWPEQLENRFWRFFAGLVRRGRRRCAGDIDLTEINRMFGWGAEASLHLTSEPATEGCAETPTATERGKEGGI